MRGRKHRQVSQLTAASMILLLGQRDHASFAPDVKEALQETHLSSSHLSLNREGRWGTTDNFETSFLHFPPVLHGRLELGELQACPFPDVVTPPLPLSALSSSPFHCALQDDTGQTW